MAEPSSHPNINEEKLIAMIKKYENASKVEKLDYKLTPGSEKGDNYSGILIACDMTAVVDGVSKEFNWIFKLPPTDKKRIEMFREMFVEFKEVGMYTRVIPAFKKIVKVKY